jgi:hypothetical protein
MACQTAKPSFPVSSKFDGQWEGERLDVSGASICRPTTMAGSVKDGQAQIVLHYNSTLLTGWVAEDGSMVLDGNHPHWIYKFTGRGQGNEIKGDWFVGNAPCRGTWYLRRK